MCFLYTLWTTSIEHKTLYRAHNHRNHVCRCERQWVDNGEARRPTACEYAHFRKDSCNQTLNEIENPNVTENLAS